jgi:hypothetical protein
VGRCPTPYSLFEKSEAKTFAFCNIDFVDIAKDYHHIAYSFAATPHIKIFVHLF